MVKMDLHSSLREFVQSVEEFAGPSVVSQSVYLVADLQISQLHSVCHAAVDEQVIRCDTANFK